ncbi:hypothetical protein [Sphingobium sufflavum]|uniref:hypothetical protein n=1 Tax=Sphingobium sufflavum TaxID=1129547 RepID=UPI001F476C11|nr:hypothetical protein [Sphingobium sufflavum]
MMLATFAVACLVVSPAFAGQNDDARFRVGVTGGTLGIGPEVAYRLNDRLGVRANATFLSVSHSFDSDGLNYDGNVKLGSGGVMLDVFPFKGGFRISGGVRINGNKAHAIARPSNSNGSYTIGLNTYTATEIGTLRADTELNDVAPILTVGYGGGTSSGFTFGVEAGALFQGGIRIKPLTYTGAITGAARDRLLADLERERASVQDDIDDYKVYPVVQISVGYRF